MSTYNLTAKVVVERMRSGDLPVVTSSFSMASAFNDGTVVPHQVMQAAADVLGIGAAPARGQRWAIPEAAIN